MSEEAGQVLRLLFAFGLVLLNGFFVMAEFALVKVRQSRLEQLVKDGIRRADAALKVTRELDAYLSATQLGITLASLGLGWLGAPAIARLILPFFASGPFSVAVSHTFAGVLAFALITVFHIVLGELAPKSAAIQQPEAAALVSARPLMWFYRLMYPFIYALNGLSLGLLRLIGLKPASEAHLAHSEDELKLLLLKSHRHGLLGATQRDLLAGIFDFSERTVKEVMTPRHDVACVSASMRASEGLEAVRQFGFTRYPVCDGDKDHVVGVLHFRELTDAADTNPKGSVTDVMHSALVLPEHMPVSEALKQIQTRKSHLAVVADEYGRTAGIVTLEDILEELVGEIYDELDTPPEDKVRTLRPGVFEFDGGLIIEDVEDVLDVDLHHAGIETIGGYIFGRLGRKPQEGDTVKVGEVVFDVVEVKGTRIRRLRAQRSREAPPAKPSTE